MRLPERPRRWVGNTFLVWVDELTSVRAKGEKSRGEKKTAQEKQLEPPIGVIFFHLNQDARLNVLAH